jgi:hypothetical protein
MKEIWKPIIGFEELYEISSLGKVKSLSRIIIRNSIKNNFNKKESFLKPSLSKVGYFTVILCKNNLRITKKVHQLVAESFLGHIPCGYKLVVNHKNFIRTDNRVDNLEIITQRENANRKHLRSSSKYTGVCWDKHAKKWKSNITINGKSKHIGNFNNEKEASIAYEKKLLTLNK